MALLQGKAIGEVVREFVPIHHLHLHIENVSSVSLYDYMPRELATYYAYYLAKGVGIENLCFIVNYLLNDPGVLGDLPKVYRFPDSEAAYECLRSIDTSHVNKYHAEIMYSRDDIDLFKKLDKSYVSEESLLLAIAKKASQIATYIFTSLIQ